jgi:hypothetical protein
MSLSDKPFQQPLPVVTQSRAMVSQSRLLIAQSLAMVDASRFHATLSGKALPRRVMPQDQSKENERRQR